MGDLLDSTKNTGKSRIFANINISLFGRMTSPALDFGVIHRRYAVEFQTPGIFGRDA